MSIIRITEGKHTTEIEGSWTVFTETFDAYAGQFSHFTATNGTNFGNPRTAPKKNIDNAFIPVVIIEESTDTYYSVVTSKNHWTLDKLISPSLQKPFVKEVKFKTSDKLIPINFNVKKGNPKANDSDGGNITAKYFDSKYRIIGKIIFKNLKYNDHFVFKWDKTKDITQIDFFADDNDSIFNGGVENVYCGSVKLYKENCPICANWDAIAPIIPKEKYEGYRIDCHVATEAQLNVMGYKEGFPRYQIAKALRDKNKKVIKLHFFKEEFEKGVNYIKSALKKNIPVTVGIDNHDDITRGNPDLTTDHFVVIVGMGSDREGKYFLFYDNADSATGASKNNKLYCNCKQTKISGSTDQLSRYGRGLVYTVTSIRTSIKK